MTKLASFPLYFKNHLLFFCKGQYIFEEVQKSEDLCVDFVWNRSFEKIKHLPEDVKLENLDDFKTRLNFVILLDIPRKL